MPLSENVDLRKLADMTDGFTGADLMALCKKAAMKSLRRLPKEYLDKDKIPPQVLEEIMVTIDDFLDALKELKPSGYDLQKECKPKNTNNRACV